MSQKYVWIDLDNSPHVPFFFPIIKKLESRGFKTVVTARDCFQVCGLAEKFNMNFKKVGRHYGSNFFLKVMGTFWRSAQLLPHVYAKRPILSVSHGSRSLTILSHALRIPTVLIFDYEHAARVPVFKPILGIAPEIIDKDALEAGFRNGIVNYPGLKEDVYISSYSPDPDFLQKMNLSSSDMIVTIRPPATEAHYHNPEAEPLFVEVVEYLGESPSVKMVILPRNEISQKQFILEKWPHWCKAGKITIPDQVVNGLDMIWHSDLVVSGGGTMNREAAALQVPVYSIFRGKMGAVDKYLSERGRLTFIENINDVRTKIKPEKRVRQEWNQDTPRPALDRIVTAIDEVIADL